MLKIMYAFGRVNGQSRRKPLQEDKNVCFVTSRNLHIDVCVVERIARADMAFKFIKTSGVPRTTSQTLSCAFPFPVLIRDTSGS